MPVRLTKVAMAAALAAFAFVVAFSNVTDYGSNHQFVAHVLSMDTTFEGNRAMWRAITAPALWTAAYWLIIATEALCAALFGWGAVAMWRARTGPAAGFEAAKAPFVAGALAAFLLWFFGFMVIGGEWFLMWQSEIWNGQQAAFRISIMVMATLIFVNQPDRELAR